MFAIALVVRLVYLYQLRGTVLFSVLIGDGRVYDEWAQRIASGQGFGSDVFYQTPLYPSVLALIYRVAGHDVFAVRIVQAVWGAMSCALLALAAGCLFDRRVGVVAGFLLALYGPAVFFDGLIRGSHRRARTSPGRRAAGDDLPLCDKPVELARDRGVCRARCCRRRAPQRQS